MPIGDHIHNYYEKCVTDVINQIARPKGYSEDQLIDLACLALNHLPTRYFRHEVDMVFYMSQQEIEDIKRRCTHAVHDAISFLDAHKTNS